MPGWDYYAIRKNADVASIFMKAQTREGTWTWCCDMDLPVLLRCLDAQHYVVLPEEMTYV